MPLQRDGKGEGGAEDGDAVKVGPAARVDFGSDFMAAEASLTDDMQTMIFMYVDLQKKDILVVSSTKDKSGKWSTPKPLD